ncbi:MAG: PPOX class F420-dependent oxidoreductase [Thermomicrobiales bacterium]
MDYSARDPFPGIDRTGFVLLTSFKRDGTPVPTTVWIVRDGERMIVTSSDQAGKTKRIRNDGRVTLTSSDVAGNTDGESVEGRARVLPVEEVDALVPLFFERYGDQARQLMASHEAMFQRAMIEIVPA